jgi:TolB-like protein/AraC-like DNA-binding protein/Tfp pilus assembly protein PilF
MSNTSIIKSSFIEKAEAIVLENISNEQFGVSQLAELMHMSRSNLLRKIKKETTLSASKFISKVRLIKSKELLEDKDLTISEISYQVGFGSSSYFIKCFREYYGYPPGELGKKIEAEVVEVVEDNLENSSSFLIRNKKHLFSLLGLLVVFSAFYFFNNQTAEVIEEELDKTIAVLPFKNESNDSLNLYFVNGLMESTSNNLQRIEDLRVISRTSVEKYRNTSKGIPEIAEDLNVNYLVEGSGQRIGNQILLNIQLINASTNTPIWAEQYSREVGDVFALQNEVSKKIANAIKAIITPAELKLIDKKPTENLLAYDFYLQALESFYTRTKEGYKKAIPLFEKAIENDPEFALAFANLSISYYYLDIFQKQKKYLQQINNYADKALLYDSKSDISLIAKALYYMYNEEYRLAVPHLEKALEYNPNSSAVVQVLSLLYANNIPNTGKHLKYALMGIQLDVGANDSIGKSYRYLSLSSALVQTGFTEKALAYINKSLEYNPKNYYAPYLKILILFARDKDIKRTTSLLEVELKKDTTRMDLMQEVANFHYYQGNFEKSYFYFKRFVESKEKYGLNIYPHEDIKIGFVYNEMGFNKEATSFFNAYTKYCEEDTSIYKSASLAVKYAYEGDNEKAIKQLQIFATENNYQYWILIFMDIDPVMESLKKDPRFVKVIKKIKNRFWENQTNLKKSLEEKALI